MKFNLEVFSQKIAMGIGDELKLNNDNTEVIAYGIFAMIQMIYNIILVVIFGLMFNVLIESLIVSFTISILRKSSGGVHAKSANICAVVGTIISIIIGLVSKININNIDTFIIFTFTTFILSIYITYKLAPKDSVAKPIRTEKKIKRLKKASIGTLGIYFVIVCILIYVYIHTNSYNLIAYSICVIGGVIWQVFSLTNIAYKLVKLVDTFLINIILCRKESENNEKN